MTKNIRIDGRIRVCTQFSLSVECPEDIPEEKIGWKVYIHEDKKKIRLEEITKEDSKAKTILLGKEIKVSGKKISFVVPKEWGQKTVTFEAYLLENEKELVKETYLVLDHIVAAFYRIDPRGSNPFAINRIHEAQGSTNYFTGRHHDEALANAYGKGYKVGKPVHHNQGMYRDGNTFYISASVQKPSDPFVYVIDATENEFTHRDTLLFSQGLLPLYRHPGGLQVANNILALGFEEYNYRFFQQKGEDFSPDKVGLVGSAGKKKTSVTGFFDLTKSNAGTPFEIDKTRLNSDINYYKEKEKEYDRYSKEIIYENEKIGLKETDDNLADIASAVAIIYESDKNRYIVAVRGDSQGIKFYYLKVDGGSLERAVEEKINNIGEFQNVNLFFDEKKELYMFGMSSDEVCSIYKVELDKGQDAISAIWIDETSGLITSQILPEKPKKDKSEDGKSKDKDKIPSRKNKIKFTFDKNTSSMQPSFNWASCVCIAEKRKKGKLPPIQLIENSNDKTKSTKKGFEGQFLIYAVGAIVQQGFNYSKAWDDFRQQQDKEKEFPGIVYINSSQTEDTKANNETSDDEFFFNDKEEEKAFGRYLESYSAFYSSDSAFIEACYFSEKK